MSLVSPHVTQNWLNYVYEVAFFIFVHVCFNGICIGMLFFENLIKKECAYSDMISANCTYCTSIFVVNKELIINALNFKDNEHKSQGTNLPSNT